MTIDETERTDKMPVEQDIDSLIEAGWLVLYNNFSEVAYEKWRKEALKCLTSLCGTDHPYTEYFKNEIFEEKIRRIPVGVGVLEAAKASHPGVMVRFSDNAFANGYPQRVTSQSFVQCTLV